MIDPALHGWIHPWGGVAVSKLFEARSPDSVDDLLDLFTRRWLPNWANADTQGLDIRDVTLEDLWLRRPHIARLFSRDDIDKIVRLMGAPRVGMHVSDDHLRKAETLRHSGFYAELGAAIPLNEVELFVYAPESETFYEDRSIPGAMLFARPGESEDYFVPAAYSSRLPYLVGFSFHTSVSYDLEGLTSFFDSMDNFRLPVGFRVFQPPIPTDA